MNDATYQEVPASKRPMSYFFKAGCAAEFKLMRLRELPVAQPVIATPQQAYEFHSEHVQSAPWYDPDKEAFVVLFLDTRRKICGFALISLGTLDTVHVHPREVFRPAIVHGTAAIVLMHNLCASAHKLCYVEHPLMWSGTTHPRKTAGLALAQGQLLHITTNFESRVRILRPRSEPGKLRAILVARSDGTKRMER